jgi:pimeloyl-ACP methyl ester carboxylesterase
MLKAVSASLLVLAPLPVLAQEAPRAPVAGDVLAKAPPAPDYADAANWSMAWQALPAGAKATAKRGKVSVFFLHPTTFRSPDGALSQDVRDAASNLWTDESSIARQASAFGGCCQVYAPRYRAASYNSFAVPDVQQAAFALAYGDVERAFDAFLAKIGDAPFIIAGHSQGAFHAATLLEKRIDGTALQKRLVAAYIIGINLSEGEFGRRFKSVKPCASPSQTGCVLQWNAYLADQVDAAMMQSYATAAYVKKFGTEEGKQLLCINPLTFDAARPEADASMAQGTVPGDPGKGAPKALVAHAVSARCEKGMLLVKPDKALGLEPLRGGVMHYHDIGLFWANIRANVALRAKAFR